MAVTVYLSNTDIEVVTGQGSDKSVTAKKIYSMQVPEGSVLNGVITDGPALVEELSGFWKSNKLPTKGIQLVVNTPQIMVRVLEVPLQKQNQTMQYLKREFLDRDEKQIIGFYRISTDKAAKKSRVCTEIADGDFIASFEQVFQEAGIQLTEVTSGIASAINLFKKAKFAVNENCVVLLRDGMTVTAIFFVKGEYFYSTTTRVFSEPGTVEFAGEITNVINQIDQFSRAQRVEDPIDSIYLSGMEDSDVLQIENSVSLKTNLNAKVQTLQSLNGVKVFDLMHPLDRIIYPVAALSPKTEEVNILRSVVHVKSEEELKKERQLKLYVPYGITAVIMLIVTFVLLGLLISKNMYLKELEAYNDDPENQYKALDYDRAAYQAARLGQHYAGLQILDKNIDSYPIPNSSVVHIVERDSLSYGDVDVSGYDAATGVLSFSTTMSSVDREYEYVDVLKSEPIFTQVNHKGYQEMSTEDQWAVLLQCILSEDAGRE
ncbi:MAG: hypothetical protein K6G07_06080 [Lachnospiraceae bacterium]|nr:hypothetical protein [Lachnospiraceae bacterium]